MRTCSSVLVLALCLVLTGCDAGSPAEEPPPDLLPLAVGTVWIMEVENTRADRTTTDIDTLTVVSDTSIAGETWYRLEHSYREAAYLPNGYYANRPDGVWRLRFAPDGSATEQLVFKYPSTTGDTYPVREGATARVVDTDARFAVPFGTPPSVHYKETVTAVQLPGRVLPMAEPAVHDLYMAPGVGPVRLECFWARRNAEEQLVVIGAAEARLVAFQPAP